MKPVTNRLAHNGLFIFFPFYFLWRKIRKGTLVVALIVVVLLTSCFQYYFRTATKNSVDAATLKRLQNSSKYFIIHYNDNTAFGLSNAVVNDNNVEGDLVELPEERKGYLNPKPEKPNRVRKANRLSTLVEVHLYYPQPLAAGQSHVSIPLSSINRMDVYEFDRGATTANHVISWIGIGVGGAALIASVFALILVATCNCPQVYVSNNGQYEFTGGVYSGALYSTLERTDYLPLPPITPVDNQYRFRIGNVPEEEQFINQVQLLKIQHPSGVKVLADRHGKIFTYANTLAPSSATYDDGTDVTQQLKSTDAKYYSFNSKPQTSGFSTVTLSFNKPDNATKGKLLVRAGNSKWSGYLYKEFASLFGDSYKKWREQQEKSTTPNPEQWQLDQALPLKVFVETEHGWQYVDHFALTGNTASRDMIMEIDLSAVNPNSGKTNIRLESTFQFWDLDMVAMNFSDNAAVKASLLDAVSVMKNDGSDNQKALFQKDTEYCHLLNNDHITLTYNAPASEANTSFFLVSTGYYHSLRNFEGKADVQSLMKFKEKGFFDKFSRNKYAVIEEALAKSQVKQPAGNR